MMSATHTIRLKLFKEQVEKFKGDVVKEFDRRRKEFAVSVLAKVISVSPFSSGSYISSHKVGVNLPDSTFSLFPPGFVSKSTASQNALSAGTAKIMASNVFDTIYITNSVPHAANVELIGWQATPPYHVFGLTYEYMSHRISFYMGK